jgi:hypothetical protein
VGRKVTRKARQSRGHEPVHGSGSQPESAHGVCGGSPQNRRVTWLCHKTKTEDSTSGDRIRARREASMPEHKLRDLRACVRRTPTAVKAWPPDENIHVLTILPLRGMYLHLSSGGLHIYSSRVGWQLILLDCFLIALLYWLDFSMCL